MTALTRILRNLRARRTPVPPPIALRPVRFEWATPDWYDAAKEDERDEDEWVARVNDELRKMK